MTVTPQGQINLCKTPLEDDYKNQLTFNSYTEQYNYFLSTTIQVFNDYTYIKKDNSITVHVPIDSIRECNYLFYKNIGFTEKRYYCFITNLEYVSENATRITFQTDVFQTWYFSIVYNPCFVEREHVNNDTIGLHTVPENLETGEYIVNQEDDIEIFSSFYIGMAVTVYPSSEYPGSEAIPATRKMYNGIFSGFAYIIAQDVDSASNILKIYEKMGRSDAVQSVFLIPRSLCTGVTWVQVAGYTYIGTYGELPNSNDIYGFSSTGITQKTTLGSYEPKNKKMLVYPYCYGLISNNSGNTEMLYLEDFGSTKLSFSIECALTQGISTKITPQDYKNISVNYEFSINGGKIPICSWQSDAYANWLKQNSINLGVSAITDVGQIIAGASTLPLTGMMGIGSIASGINGIVGTLSSVYEHSLISPSVSGNINNGDVNYSIGLYNPKVYQMCIKEEYAKIIDDYFSMFGYKVNNVKVPNLTGRNNWNYVKTIDCNFTGDIPQDDIKIIRQMFNNGVTLWHSPNTIYNYNNDNSIV